MHDVAKLLAYCWLLPDGAGAAATASTPLAGPAAGAGKGPWTPM